MLKKVALIGILALLCFSAAAAGGWLLLNDSTEPEGSTQTADGDLPTRPTANQGQPSELPVPNHGKPMSPDEIFRFGETTRHQKEEIERRQEEIRKGETRLKLVEQDIDSQRKVLEGLLVQIGDQLQKGGSIEQDLLQKKQDLDSRQDAFDKKIKASRAYIDRMDKVELANLKKWAELVANMDPQTAAKHLADQCDNGDIEKAATLLHFMEERKAAAILDVLELPIVDLLLPKYLQFQQVSTPRA